MIPRVRIAVTVGARVLVVLFGTACAPSLSESGARVRMVEEARLVEGCEKLGTVTGTSTWGGPAATNQGMRDSRIEAQNAAAELGANVMLVRATRSSEVGSKMEADAYSCP